MRSQVVAERGVVNQEPLKGIICGKLAGRHDGGAARVGEPAPKVAREPFLARHADHAVDSVLVISALGGRESGIVLHAHVEDVGKVARDAAEEARGDGHGCQSGKGGFAAGAGVARLELFVDAEADGRIGELAHERGRDTRVEAADTVVAENLYKGAAHVLGGVALPCLQSDLYRNGMLVSEYSSNRQTIG